MNKENDGDVIIERLKIATHSKGYQDMTARLNIKRAWLKFSRKEGKLHPEIKNVLIKLGIDPWWVEFGVGGQRLPAGIDPEHACLRAGVPAWLNPVLEEAIEDFHATDQEGDKSAH